MQKCQPLRFVLPCSVEIADDLRDWHDLTPQAIRAYKLSTVAEACEYNRLEVGEVSAPIMDTTPRLRMSKTPLLRNVRPVMGGKGEGIHQPTELLTDYKRKSSASAFTFTIGRGKSELNRLPSLPSASHPRSAASGIPNSVAKILRVPYRALTIFGRMFNFLLGKDRTLYLVAPLYPRSFLGPEVCYPDYPPTAYYGFGFKLLVLVLLRLSSRNAAHAGITAPLFALA